MILHGYIYFPIHAINPSSISTHVTFHAAHGVAHCPLQDEGHSHDHDLSPRAKIREAHRSNDLSMKYFFS